jgi:hypothetical protein
MAGASVPDDPKAVTVADLVSRYPVREVARAGPRRLGSRAASGAPSVLDLVRRESSLGNRRPATGLRDLRLCHPTRVSRPPSARMVWAGPPGW